MCLYGEDVLGGTVACASPELILRELDVKQVHVNVAVVLREDRRSGHLLHMAIRLLHEQVPQVVLVQYLNQFLLPGAVNNNFYFLSWAMLMYCADHFREGLEVGTAVPQLRDVIGSCGRLEVQHGLLLHAQHNCFAVRRRRALRISHAGE